MRDGLKRGCECGYEKHAVEPDRLRRSPRKSDMGFVGRVEASAHDACLFHAIKLWHKTYACTRKKMSKKSARSAKISPFRAACIRRPLLRCRLREKALERPPVKNIILIMRKIFTIFSAITAAVCAVAGPSSPALAHKPCLVQAQYSGAGGGGHPSELLVKHSFFSSYLPHGILDAENYKALSKDMSARKMRTLWKREVENRLEGFESESKEIGMVETTSRNGSKLWLIKFPRPCREDIPSYIIIYDGKEGPRYFTLTKISPPEYGKKSTATLSECSLSPTGIPRFLGHQIYIKNGVETEFLKHVKAMLESDSQQPGAMQGKRKSRNADYSERPWGNRIKDR